MKKVIFLLFAAALMTGCSNEPVETIITKTNVEIIGNSFTSFKLGSDVRLFMAQDPSDNSQWTIKATVPIQKVDGNHFNDLTIDMNLLDANKLKVRDDLTLAGEDIASILPIINTVEGVEKNIIFSANENSKKSFTYKEAVDILNNTKALTCSFNNNAGTVTSAKSSATSTDNGDKKYNDPPKTVNDLCMKYGIYGKLSQYDKALYYKEKKKAKVIEDEMYQICKRVKNDPNVSSYLADQFKKYVEDREDKIEDKY